MAVRNLFLIDGAAGTGKTDMLEYLASKHSGRDVAIIPKFTTRSPRQAEIDRGLTLDLNFVTRKAFAEYQKHDGFYSYRYGEELYGFYRKDIESELNTHTNAFVIVRDRATIQQVQTDLPEIRTVPTFIYTDKAETRKRLDKEKYTKEEVAFRLNRLDLSWDDYLKHFQLYEEILINNSHQNDFKRLIDALVRKYSPEAARPDQLDVTNTCRFILVPSLIGFKTEIERRLTNYDRNVFLMMKYRPSNDLLHEYIRDTLAESGFNCIRADYPAWNITDNVYNPIALTYCCKYGIALFDEPEPANLFSPNVAYELAIMHVHRKKSLILCHDSLPEPPFDLIKDLRLTYNKDLEVKKIVKRWISEVESTSSPH